MIFIITLFIIENIFSIVILFVFEFIVIVIVVIIIAISFVVIVVKVIIEIILTTFIKELIAFHFDMIMLFVINTIFDELLNDFVVEIKYNALLKFNNNDIF